MTEGQAGQHRLARLVKQHRQNLGLSLRAAAKKAGVDRATWTGMEDGSRETQDRHYAGIERALEWPSGSIDAIRRDLPMPAGLVDSPSHANPRGTLGDLIAARRNQVHLTYEQLSAQAAELGHQISTRMLTRLANDNPPEYPEPATLRAVAAALDVPLTEVHQAAIRSAHLWPAPKHNNRVGDWVQLVCDLEPAEIEQVLHIARATAHALKSRTSGEVTQPCRSRSNANSDLKT